MKIIKTKLKNLVILKAKIITVVQGKILDVVVDLRKNSKTYGKYFAIKISQKSDFSLYIPENFAHGFLCLSKNCAVYYKCSNYRNKSSETTIKWNDDTLKIKWPVKKPILSKKDKMSDKFPTIFNKRSLFFKNLFFKIPCTQIYIVSYFSI